MWIRAIKMRKSILWRCLLVIIGGTLGPLSLTTILLWGLSLLIQHLVYRFARLERERLIDLNSAARINHTTMHFEFKLWLLSLVCWGFIAVTFLKENGLCNFEWLLQISLNFWVVIIDTEGHLGFMSKVFLCRCHFQIIGRKFEMAKGLIVLFAVCPHLDLIMSSLILVVPTWTFCDSESLWW